ncbi:MAG: zf-TFIIB domain-containing protein [Archangium sp.]|nr:zf-TFIIB domain-containing protein [Archangium sp.]
MRARTCPTHRTPMQRLISSTPAGRELELDRCGECGGLWFDAGELELTATHRALPAGPGFEYFCPSCSDPARDPAVGGQFAAARCNACQGTWLDGPTVAALADQHLPRPPDASQKSPELGFLCAGCEARFPYEQGNITASGLVCRSCLKSGAARAPKELGNTLDAVLRFLSA